ncbi:hypothetical protein Csa_002365 [Cucumis sativus]|uniref:Uncharacterized protein n=1 Tax=Cucumis sativus TaxID=3659 RepID=A0A0A0LFI4_CUCSA|nr:hypothetical protein Csa_002365 [Cucumis sativus]
MLRFPFPSDLSPEGPKFKSCCYIVKSFLSSSFAGEVKLEFHICCNGNYTGSV